MENDTIETEMTAEQTMTPSLEETRKVKMFTEDLKAYFGTFRALHGIDMRIFSNRATAIIGPSGCGKSTFIRCLNRMHEFVPGARTEGKVFLDEKDLFKKDIDLIEIRRSIGMVFQRPNPFPTLSIYDNVCAGLKLSGIKNKSFLNQAVEESLLKAALWEEVKDKLNHSGMSLSGGQQQRLCIARALAVKPEVILFDEPCSALDPISTGKVEELIHSLKENYTIVIVTHNMQQAARISDYTGYFYLGTLVEFGATKKIFTNPDKQETEDYITGRFG